MNRLLTVVFVAAALCLQATTAAAFSATSVVVGTAVVAGSQSNRRDPPPLSLDLLDKMPASFRFCATMADAAREASKDRQPDNDAAYSFNAVLKRALSMHKAVTGTPLSKLDQINERRIRAGALLGVMQYPAYQYLAADYRNDDRYIQAVEQACNERRWEAREALQSGLNTLNVLDDRPMVREK